MADYNIYIHSLEEGGTSSQGNTGAGFNPTKPWELQTGTGESDAEKLSKETPNMMASAQETATIAKASPWLAVAYAVIKIAYSTTKTVSEYTAIRTGDFRVVRQFQNYESLKNAVFHPISTSIQTLKSMALAENENQRREMNRELLGDSEINRYSNRGY